MRKQMLAAAVMAACAGTAPVVMADYTTEDGATTLAGKMYADFTTLRQKSDGSKTDATGTGVDVKRFYLGVTHDFDEMWSANLTTDFNYVSGDGETQLFVKKAYIQAKLSDAAVLRGGSADMPWIPFVEGLYGNRFLENTLIDRLKFGTSADWGLHAGGKLADGMVNYAASVVNGGGYKNPSRSKTMDFAGRLALVPVKGLTFAGGVYTGKLGKEKETDTADAVRTATRWDLLAAYVGSNFRVGTEYFNAKNWDVTAAESDKAYGYSVWGAVNPAEKITLFARYDYAKPHKDTNSSLKDNYYNVGVSYKARKNVDLALAYKHDKVDNGSISTSNGTIGGSNDGSYDEIGVWTQVVF